VAEEKPERLGQFRFQPEFRTEFADLPRKVKTELANTVLAIQKAGGPAAGRPYVDTLKGSKHANMKELRFSVESEVWRFAFAYDPTRNAVVLCGGDKQGVTETFFYGRLVEKADKRYDAWLKTLEKARLAKVAEAKVKTKAAKRFGKSRKGWKR